MTKQELQAMSLKGLAVVYNKHAAKPIKNFSGKKDEAIARVLSVLPKEEKKAKGTGTGTKSQGIGKFIIESLGKNLPIVEIVGLVAETFPGSKTTPACVYWYRSAIKSGRVAA